MKMHCSTCNRAAFILVALWSITLAELVSAQAPADTDSPKVSEPFVFTLSPPHDNAVNVVAKSIEQHDEILRVKELESVNAPVLAKALDLLRYIPIRFSISDADDFFIPNYLRRNYDTVPPEAHLFDTR